MEKFLQSNGTEDPGLFYYGPLNLGPNYLVALWNALQNRQKIQNTQPPT